MLSPVGGKIIWFYRWSSKTYNEIYRLSERVARNNVLFPDCDSYVLSESFQELGLRNVSRIRDVTSFDSGIGAVATFDTIREAREVVEACKGVSQTAFFKRHRSKVRRVLSSKNKQFKSVLHLESMRYQSFSNQLLHNHLLTASSPVHLEDKFFVYGQLKDIIQYSSLSRNNFESSDVFGSCMNGFGSQASDLDVCLRLREPFRRNSVRLLCELQNMMVKRQDIFSSAHSIRAKVPVICFAHRFLPINGDVTFGSKESDLAQSRLSFLFSGFNPSITPVFLAIKQLLRHHQIIASYAPGYLTSFQLLIMYIFFLMQSKIVPCVAEVFEFANNRDLGDILPSEFEAVTKQQHNDIDMENLFLSFFEFVAKFDFENCKMDPITGLVKAKSFRDVGNSSAVIINPVNADHNICRSTSEQKTTELQLLAALVADAPFKNLYEYFDAGFSKKFRQRREMATTKVTKTDTKSGQNINYSETPENDVDSIMDQLKFS